MMNNNSIDIMPAGEKIDSYIAQKVMGYWKEKDEYDSSINQEIWWQKHGSLPNEKMYASIGYLVGSYRENCLPLFSTNMSAAWVVGEKIDIEYVRRVYRVNGGDVVWSGWEAVILGMEIVLSSSADTIPLAICRVACKKVAS